MKWVPVPDAPDEVALVQAGRQVGSYSHATKTYRPYYGRDQWGAAAKPPVAPPAAKPSCACGPACDCPGKHGEACRCAAALPDWQTTGVSKELVSRRERVSVNGREVTMDEGLE